MNNVELERVLRSASVPERAGEYWERFPGQVTAEIHRGEAVAQVSKSAPATPGRRSWLALVLSQPTLALGAAAACLLLGFFLGTRTAWHTSTDPQFTEARKCFNEIAPLFPNQVQTIVFDAAGAHLVLSEQADVPASPPLYVKITGPKGEQRFVTFSGQRIRVNGDSFDVLVDRQGEVLLVGKQSVWSSSDPGVKAGPYRIEARPLPANS